MRAHETLERAGRQGGFPARGSASGLLAACPSDGSHDFYLSMMLDVPVPRVPMLRARLQDSRRGRNAHPTYRKLAAWCKCSVGTVKRHLSWLEGGRVVMEQRFRLRDGSPVMPRWRR